MIAGQVPKEVCTNVPREQCRQVERQVPKQVEKEVSSFSSTQYNRQKITYCLQQESGSENHGETFQVCQDIPRQQSRQVPKQVSSYASDVSNMIWWQNQSLTKEYVLTKEGQWYAIKEFLINGNMKCGCRFAPSKSVRSALMCRDRRRSRSWSPALSTLAIIFLVLVNTNNYLPHLCQHHTCKKRVMLRRRLFWPK